MKHLPSFILSIIFLGWSGLTPIALAQNNENPESQTESKPKEETPSLTESLEKGAEELGKALEGLFGGSKNKEANQEEPKKEKTESGNDVQVRIEPAEPEEVLEPNDFIGSFTLEAHRLKNGKPERGSPSQVDYHLDAYQFAVVPKVDDTQTILIYHRDEEKITQKVTSKRGDKTATITPMININVTVEDKDVADGEIQIEPTGRSKSIEGYTCQEYRVESPDEITLCWVSKDLDLDWRKVAPFVKAKGPRGTIQPNNLYGLEGLVLEAHIESKEGDWSSDYYLKNISIGKVNAEIFSLEGYKVTDLNSLFGK